ncbi:MAG: hypothetical protein IKH45_08415 [Neisseriaceae bacterium]|nr:hypothetical protein [Neisseriaceae bacterium]
MISLKSITRQSLPDEEYLKLLGIAICVFNSNNAFVIENILKLDTSSTENWYDLIDLTSGHKKMKEAIDKTIGNHELGERVKTSFCELVDMRNRIIHSFQITSDSGEQILATKYRENDEEFPSKQFHITKEYLLEFIEKNQKLSDLLDEIKGY